MADTWRSAHSDRPGSDAGAAPETGDHGRLPALPKPTSRTILWTPRTWDPTGDPPEREFDLFIRQSALRDVAMHISTPGGGEGYGMLVGRLCRCPATETTYVVIDEAHPSPHRKPGIDDRGHLSRFREFWLSISMKAGRDGKELVGWYHAHSRLGLSLSKRDERLHNEHFPNCWQCALVLPSGPVMQEGGFFQRDPQTGAFHGTPAPFYEVVPDDGWNRTPITSWAGWSNYRPDRSVAVPRARRRDAAFELVVVETTGAAAMAVESGQPAAEQMDPGRANGVEESAETGGAPAPTASLVKILEEGRARRRRRRILRVAAAVSSVLVAAGALAWADSAGRIDLGEMSRDVNARSRALTRSLALTLLPTTGGTADGQAGAVPMARGQDPGAPSADSPMNLARPVLNPGGTLLERIQEYGRIRAAAGDDRPVDCELLRAAYDRVESTAQLDVADRSTSGLEAALEEVRRDFGDSGCRVTE